MPRIVEVPPPIIDPDSPDLRDKRAYWKKWSRAYMSQIPGPICVCETKPQVWTVDGVRNVVYSTMCSTYR